MQQPLISIIVPVYNAEKYLHRCIASLLKQTYTNIEIILVNDGSTDDSWSLCLSFAEKYENIFAYQKDNGGAASARNRGMDYANGEYFAFVDADDYVQDIFIEKLYGLCVRFDSEIAMCDFAWVSSDKCDFDLLVENTVERVNTPMEMMYRCCNKNKTSETIIWNKLYKRSLFDTLRYPEGMTYEDLAMTHKILFSATSIAECNNKMYAYFMSDNSVTRKKYNMLNFTSENKAQDERLEFFKALGDDKLFQKAVISIQRNRIANYCKCYIDLPECKVERKTLKEKFLIDQKYINKNTSINMQDKVLFALFKFSPWICARVLWPIYLKLDSKGR